MEGKGVGGTMEEVNTGPADKQPKQAPVPSQSQNREFPDSASSPGLCLVSFLEPWRMMFPNPADPETEGSRAQQLFRSFPCG